MPLSFAEVCSPDLVLVSSITMLTDMQTILKLQCRHDKAMFDDFIHHSCGNDDGHVLIYEHVCGVGR